MLHKTHLDAKVAAVNAAHAYAIQLYPVLAEFFADYVGQKIEKQDGSLLKKIQDAMPAFPDSGVSNRELHVYRTRSDYSLIWTVKTCESFQGRRPDDCSAAYYEVNVYVGNKRDGILESLHEPPTLRTDYTAERIQAARDMLQAAKEAVSRIESGLYPFGE